MSRCSLLRRPPKRGMRSIRYRLLLDSNPKSNPMLQLRMRRLQHRHWRGVGIVRPRPRPWP